VFAAVALFAAHRVAVILSAGDFLFPIEPWEGKNTQIAWDMLEGRFGLQGFTLSEYVTNAGATHHASFSSTSLVYWVVSKIFGFGLLGVRLTPLLFWIAALALWGEGLRRTLHAASGVLAVVGLFAVSSTLVAWQLTFFGCHSESVLPLAAALVSWLAWISREERSPLLAGITGLCFGYAAAFSYLLWPILGLMALITALPPRPALRWGPVGALIGGLVVGLWPLWLIIALNPGALFTLPVTEDPGTRLADISAGQGGSLSLFWTTLTKPLRGFGHDYWMATDVAGALWGRMRFEGLAWRLTIFGPLALIPLAWALRREAAGKLALLVAVAPVICLLYIAYGSPFKPELPLRYLIPLAFLGLSAPAVAVGCGIKLLRDPAPSTARRVGAWVAIVASALALAWLAPPRLKEASNLVRSGRAGDLLEHRYVAYYNLGIGTTWAEQVPEVNDLLDVRAAENRPDAFAGMQAGLLHDLQPTGLGLATWAPHPLEAESLTLGLSEWSERQYYKSESTREYLPVTAENIGWGTGIRTRWQAAAANVAIQGAHDLDAWPEQLSVESFWEGYGLGWGRADAAAPTAVEMMPRSIPEAYHEAVVRGVVRGRTLPAKDWWGEPPPFPSIRKPAQ